MSVDYETCVERERGADGSEDVSVTKDGLALVNGRAESERDGRRRMSLEAVGGLRQQRVQDVVHRGDESRGVLAVGALCVGRVGDAPQGGEGGDLGLDEVERRVGRL